MPKKHQPGCPCCGGGGQTVCDCENMPLFAQVTIPFSVYCYDSVLEEETSDPIQGIFSGTKSLPLTPSPTGCFLGGSEEYICDPQFTTSKIITVGIGAPPDRIGEAQVRVDVSLNGTQFGLTLGAPGGPPICQLPSPLVLPLLNGIFLSHCFGIDGSYERKVCSIDGPQEVILAFSNG